MMHIEYISKQKAIDELCNVDEYNARSVATIKAINPAHVRPIIDGNWIPVTNGRGGNECSRCHQYAPSYQAGGEYLSRFCPFCGCYMGGE